MMDNVEYAPLWHPPKTIYPGEEEYQVTLFSILLSIQLVFANIVTGIGLFLFR